MSILCTRIIKELEIGHKNGVTVVAMAIISEYFLNSVR